MDDETQKIIDDRLNELPEVIRDIILKSNWKDKIRRIVTKNKLHIDQGATIENLVFVTMLGMETPEDFVENAKEYANISEDQALSISSDVEKEIFREIRDKLIEITKTSDTVGDIGRVTDELSKVAGDIEERAKLDEEEGYQKIKEGVEQKSEKKPLSEAVPKGSFNKPVEQDVQIPKRGSLDKAAEKLEEKKEEIEKVKFKPVPPTIPEKPVEDNIISDKLSGSFSSKKESAFLRDKKEREAEKSSSNNISPEQEKVKGNYKERDPYREPID